MTHTKIPLIALSLPLILRLTNSQNPQPSKKSLQRKSERDFWLSSSQPFTNYLSSLPAIVTTTSTIQSHISSLEHSIHTALNFTGAPTLHLCNIYFISRSRKAYRRAIVRKFISRGLPEPDTNCITQITSDKNVDLIYNAMQTRGDILNANRHELIQTAISNFSTPEVVYNTQHTTLTQTCTLHYLGAIRVKARWYTNIQLTNLPTHFHVPIFTRQYVTEFIHAKGGKLSEALRMKLPVRPAGDERRKMRNDTTTIIVTGRGDVNPSFFGRQLAQDNPAVIASLERGEFFILQAADSLTLSSIAILMLPLLLNLIPVSFIADVKRGTMFVYILLSDVLTCLPLLVKGAELISISSLRHRNIVTRVSSTVNGSVSESAAAELFGAECRAKREFWGIGVAFVTIAVGFMVGGIVAEFVARIYWRRVRKRAFMTLLETGIGASGFKMGEYANKRNDVWD